MVWNIPEPREGLYNNSGQLCLGNSGQARCQTPTQTLTGTSSSSRVSKHPVQKSKEGKLCYLFPFRPNIFLMCIDNLYGFHWCFISEDSATDAVILCIMEEFFKKKKKRRSFINNFPFCWDLFLDNCPCP